MMTKDNRQYFTLTRWRWLRMAWAVSNRRHQYRTVWGILALVVIGASMIEYAVALPTVTNLSMALSMLSLLCLAAAVALFVWAIYYYFAAYRFDMESFTHGLNVGWSSNWFAVSPLVSAVWLDNLDGPDGGELHVSFKRKWRGNSEPELTLKLSWLKDHYAYIQDGLYWSALVIPRRFDDPLQNWMRPIVKGNGFMAIPDNHGVRLQSAAFIAFPTSDRYYADIARTLQSRLA